MTWVQFPAPTWWLTMFCNGIWFPFLVCMKTGHSYIDDKERKKERKKGKAKAKAKAKAKQSQKEINENQRWCTFLLTFLSSQLQCNIFCSLFLKDHRQWGEPSAQVWLGSLGFWLTILPSLHPADLEVFKPSLQRSLLLPVLIVLHSSSLLPPISLAN